jgi:hypothetical protein
MRAGVHVIEGGSGASADVHQGRRQRQRIALSGRAIPGEVDSVPERIGGELPVAPEVRELFSAGRTAGSVMACSLSVVERRLWVTRSKCP